MSERDRFLSHGGEVLVVYTTANVHEQSTEQGYFDDLADGDARSSTTLSDRRPATAHGCQKAMVLAGALLVGVTSGRSESSQPSERPHPAQIVESGSWYSSGERRPHGGKPFESENVVLYGDGASPEARQRLGQSGQDRSRSSGSHGRVGHRRYRCGDGFVGHDPVLTSLRSPDGR